LLPTITGIGISGFMKLPYKDTRFFEHINGLPDKFYPRNPKKNTALTQSDHKIATMAVVK
jgi:hypothetical protein